MTEYVITPHAAFEMRRRGLSKDMVESVIDIPEQRIEVRPGRLVLQSRVTEALTGKSYLVRVFIDVDRQPAEVVTAYRTSKIVKYWRTEG